MRSPAESGWSETQYACSWIEERLRVARDLAEEVASDPHKRAVHDVRVACRRLREAIAFFRDTASVPALPEVDGAARRMAKAVAPLREADVARDRLAALVLLERSDERDRLVRRLGRRREKLAVRRAARVQKRAARLKRAVEARLPLAPSDKSPGSGAVGETELRIALVGRVDEREREVLRRWSEIAALPPGEVRSEQLHGVRIAIKHWRYAAEIARAVMARPEYQEVASKLRRLQSAGGKSQDWADVAALLQNREVLRKAAGGTRALDKAVRREFLQASRAFTRALARELVATDDSVEALRPRL